ncbi:MAG: glycosyltransferase family 4 protein [Thermodesulfobacteriota bacterium]
MNIPKTAYVLLWFPKPSETFIFREVTDLWDMGAPMSVFTLYGELRRSLSPDMAALSKRITRLGIPFLHRLPADIRYWWKHNRTAVKWLFKTIPVRRWRSFEVGGENLWAFLCGFTLARQFREQSIRHIHAPWANGPATAAWVASKLTGIPFSFTGRAVDIYPPDGALEEKIRDATFVRTNTGTNVAYLKAVAGEFSEKIHLIYNGHTLRSYQDAPVTMRSPFRLLSLGRFARFKGYDVLLRALSALHRRGFDFQLTMAGSGVRGVTLKALSSRLGLDGRVSFPGYIPHDRVSELFRSTDVFIMPSVVHSTGEKDGIPNVIMEALLHRVPVVATDVSGIAEVIQDRETGLLVRQRDEVGLAEAITRMVSDRDAALEMARKGKDRVLKLFDPETNHRRVMALIAEHSSPRGA